jgi:membrane fusion protein (multidrug efflux system)
MRHLLLFILLSCSTALALELPVAKPQKGTIHRWITLPANAAPWQEVTIQAKVSGYLEKILVDKGDRVKAGARLAEIAVPELRADLLKWEAEVELAEQDFQRINTAMQRASDLVMKQTVDAARAKRDIAKAGLENTRAKVTYATFAAPFDGVITDRFADAGAFIADGAKLVTVMDDSTLRIRFGVPEIESALVKNGLPVTLAADSLPGKTFQATVSRNAGALDTLTRTLPVEADLKNAEQTLKPGMFLMARIGMERHDGALLIPSDALLTEKTRTSVFKLVDGKAHKSAVKTGFSDGKQVEILEGLEEKDTVVVFGKTAVVDGQSVEPKAAAAP